MCRLFGMLSVKNHRPLEHLVSDPCSLLTQSNSDSKRPQADGWGIAYLDGGIRVIKSTNAVFREPETFGKLAGEIDSTFIMAHLRRASNPRKLPKARLMAMDNVQPFLSTDTVFAHNGTVNKPNDVDLGDYRDMVVGDNDSEVLFWLLVKCLGEEGNVKKAIISMERALRHSVKDGAEPFTAVNMLFYHESALHAYCRYSSQSERSLCMGKQGYYTMSYLPGQDRVVVMSEPSNDGSGWRALDNGELLSARIDDGRINCSVDKLCA